MAGFLHSRRRARRSSADNEVHSSRRTGGNLRAITGVRPRQLRPAPPTVNKADALLKFVGAETYGFDDWNPVTISEREAQPLGLGLFGVTLTPADLAGRASLQFVRRYRNSGWEAAARHDVTLGTSGPATLRLSGAHLGRLRAAGNGADTGG